MPSPLAKAQTGDFRKVRRDTETSFKLSGVEVPAVFGSTEDDTELSPDGGGLMPVYEFSATCLLADLPGQKLPAKGREAVIEGTRYQVASAERTPGSSLATINFENLDT